MSTGKFATVITDASYCPNTRAAGYACWVVCDGERHKGAGPVPFRPKSSNEAEIHALYEGVRLCRQKFQAGSILIQSDCLGALQRFGLSGNAKKSRYISIRDSAMANRFIGETFLVMCKHVKGHTSKGDARSYVNRWCDSEARKFMKQIREGSEAPDDWQPIDTEDSW